ncbi:Speckle-type POZ protein A-like isoform X2 [Aphelenchoides besseyi]|nr:Speckle-type POZ protein A-like isoform X2 [Aphelenchoides besseyi]KAI6193080.1 Speckle-type POZ protein A-like isoform X2 [Aphelenchoides besseyi]
MPVVEWKIENFANERRQSIRDDMVVSPIYETVHQVYGPLEFTIIYYMDQTDQFVAWILFDSSLYMKASWKFNVKFWLKSSIGQISQKTNKEILVNEKYMENRLQGTLQCILPEALKDSDYLIVYFDFPFVATTPKTVATHQSFQIDFEPMDGYLVFHDNNSDIDSTRVFKFGLLPNTTFTYRNHCGFNTFTYDGECPKGVVLQFTLWVENSTGVRTPKITSNYRMLQYSFVYHHGFSGQQVYGRFGLEAISIRCCATAWIEESIESEHITGIAELYGDNECADMEIKVKDKKFKISKAIVAAHTNALNDIVVIEDMDVEMFEIMIRYMYSNKVENLDSIALGLLVVANRFKIDDLIELCVESILKNMNLTSVEDRLKFFGEISQLDEYKHHIAEYTEEWIGKMATIRNGNN